MNSSNSIVSQVANIATRRLRQKPTPEPAVQTFSKWSTPAVPHSAWCSEDFMLGAGMVIIQPATHRLVLLYDTQKKYWFLPKGRKDLGESLEQAALREAYEESGYRVELLPLYSYNHAPAPPDDPRAHNRLNTEPIFLSLRSWQPRKNRQRQVVDTGGEYLTSWYVGQIPEDAVREEGTGMPDEQNYTAYLLSIDEVIGRLDGVQRRIVQYAWQLYVSTLEWEAYLEEERAKQPVSGEEEEDSTSSEPAPNATS